MLVQAPTQIPAKVDRQRWLQAANELSQAGREEAAAQAIQALNSQK